MREVFANESELQSQYIMSVQIGRVKVQSPIALILHFTSTVRQSNKLNARTLFNPPAPHPKIFFFIEPRPVVGSNMKYLPTKKNFP